MSIVLPALAVAFAAFCVWLAVRIFNRRERWAKWTGIGLTVLLLAYPISSGPWEMARYSMAPNHLIEAIDNLFDPILEFAVGGKPKWAAELCWNYLNWWTDGQYELAPYRNVTVLNLGPESD